MKRRSRLEPVVKEQKEVEFEGVEHLCEEVTKLEDIFHWTPASVK